MHKCFRQTVCIKRDKSAHLIRNKEFKGLISHILSRPFPQHHSTSLYPSWPTFSIAGRLNPSCSAHVRNVLEEAWHGCSNEQMSGRINWLEKVFPGTCSAHPGRSHQTGDGTSDVLWQRVGCFSGGELRFLSCDSELCEWQRWASRWLKQNLACRCRSSVFMESVA